jgi:hypothetical protein
MARIALKQAGHTRADEGENGDSGPMSALAIADYRTFAAYDVVIGQLLMESTREARRQQLDNEHDAHLHTGNSRSR